MVKASRTGFIINHIDHCIPRDDARLKVCSQHANCRLVCDKSTQIHDTFIGHARRCRATIGCSETRTVGARSVLNTCISVRPFATEFSSVHVLWTGFKGTVKQRSRAWGNWARERVKSAHAARFTWRSTAFRDWTGVVYEWAQTANQRLCSLRTSAVFIF